MILILMSTTPEQETDTCVCGAVIPVEQATYDDDGNCTCPECLKDFQEDS